MVKSHRPQKMRRSGEEAEIVEKPHQKSVPQSTALEVSTPQSSMSASTFQRKNLPPIDTKLAPDLSPKSKKEAKAHTFQDAINESMQETKLMRESRIGNSEQESHQKVFMDTVNDLRSVASGTFTSIHKWAQSKNLEDLGFSTAKSEDNDDFVAPWPRAPLSPLMRATSEATPKRSVDGEVKLTNKQTRDDSQSAQHPTLLQDLTWPLMACGSEVAANLPRREELSPHIKKVRETVFKAVNGDIQGASDIWNADNDDDIMSTGSYDTLQEEKNQIRRLSSWNTINTMVDRKSVV